LISFDIDERYEDDHAVGNAISRRESVVVSVGVHALLLLAVLFLPQLEFVQRLLPEPTPVEAEVAPRVAPEEAPRFVFVQPRVELPEPEPPPLAEFSDRDRQAQDPDMASLADNPLPFSLGNSVERVEEVSEDEAAGVDQPDPGPEPESTIASREPLTNSSLDFLTEAGPSPLRGSGLLDDALQNLERYVQGQTFNNPQGGADEPGAAIQFDTRGVDFGPWLRRFIAEVYRNWFVPQSARTLQTAVVLQFNIYKDGHITDISVVRPSIIDALTRSAYNAIQASSPLDPLPEEYPLDPAFFTVTFYYN
jgi:TonB family protein